MNAPSPAAQTDQPHRNFPIQKTMATFGLMALLTIPVFLLVVLQRSAKSKMLGAGDLIPVVAMGSIEPGDALLASITGRRAAILFFTADCPHCQREIPIVNEIAKQFASEIEFAAIALGDRKKTKAFVQTNSIGGRVLVDEKGVVGRLFGVSEVPALFFVDRDQRIAWVGVGEQSRGELLRRLSILTGDGSSKGLQGMEDARR
jgi:thiol-disulfide isomerase/thioredoxin